MWMVMAEAGRRFRGSQWWPAIVTELLRREGGTPASEHVLVAYVRHLDEYVAMPSGTAQYLTE
jgi:hypothetical protein